MRSPWDTAQVIYASSLTRLGELAELTRLSPGLLNEGRERGDRYALTTTLKIKVQAAPLGWRVTW
jgi:hypothetical protein